MYADHHSVKTGSPIGRLAVVGVVLLLAAAGGFAVWRALAGPTGAATPEEAASRFFESVGGDDLVGVVEIMLPSEREALVVPLTGMAVELARLGQLSDDVAGEDGQVANAPGLSVAFAESGQSGELVYEVTPLGGRQDIQWVTVTAGTATVTFDPVEAREILGEVFLDWFGAELDGAGTEIQTETVDLAVEYAQGSPMQFAVVEEGGFWYVSLWYTVAGLNTDGGAPDPLTALTPIGAASPEEVSSELVRKAIELDPAGVAALLDPEEFRVLHDYWASFGPDLTDFATRARDDAAAGGLVWSVESVTASSVERNGRTIATIDELAIGVTSTAEGAEADVRVGLSADGLTVDGTIAGEAVTVQIEGERATGRGVVDGEPFEFDIDLTTYEGFTRFGPQLTELVREGDCLRVTVDGESELVCDELYGLSGSVAALEIQEDWVAITGRAGTPGLTVVERDGRWYVSGLPTVIHSITDFLKVIDRAQIESLVANYQELLEELVEPAF